MYLLMLYPIQFHEHEILSCFVFAQANAKAEQRSIVSWLLANDYVCVFDVAATIISHYFERQAKNLMVQAQ